MAGRLSLRRPRLETSRTQRTSEFAKFSSRSHFGLVFDASNLAESGAISEDRRGGRGSSMTF
jgi:hypothetical protein